SRWHATLERTGPFLPDGNRGRNGPSCLAEKCPSGTREHLDQQTAIACTSTVRKTFPCHLQPAPARPTSTRWTKRCGSAARWTTLRWSRAAPGEDVARTKRRAGTAASLVSSCSLSTSLLQGRKTHNAPRRGG